MQEIVIVLEVGKRFAGGGSDAWMQPWLCRLDSPGLFTPSLYAGEANPRQVLAQGRSPGEALSKAAAVLDGALLTDIAGGVKHDD